MAKGNEIILFAPNFLAMPFALRHVQVVMSIARRSDQTAKHCLLTPPPPVPPLHLLNDYAKCSIQTGMYQMPHLESAHTSPHAFLSGFSIDMACVDAHQLLPRTRSEILVLVMRKCLQAIVLIYDSTACYGYSLSHTRICGSPRQK